MSIRIPRPVLFLLAYVLATALYWPSLNGTPIWDDYLFWFGDPVMHPNTSYGTIFKNFAWPVSVAIQKYLLSVWNSNYTNYHVFNLILHFANAFLVYRLGRWLKINHSFILFALFLLHPVAVISTAWMIQIKTLLCFFFALVSILFYLKGQKKHWWILASWIFFSLSLLSKSASLVLLPVFIYVSYRKNKFQKLYFTIPFILISLWSAYRVIKSPVTVEASEKVEKLAALKIEEKPPVQIVEKKVAEKKPEERKVVKKVKKKKEIVKVSPPKEEPKPEIKKEPEVKPPVKPASEVSKDKSLFKFDLGLVAQSLHYYFWQTVLPLNNHPIKGLNYQKAGITDYLHVFFLITLIVTLWNTTSLFLLACGHLLIIPFLGFVSAPYMSITWVSDQHLYLALPLFIGVWVKLLEKIKLKFKLIIPVLFIIAFSYKTYETSTYYKNQFVFYEKSLEYNPYNIPIAYNLAYSRIMAGHWSLGYNLLVDTYELSEKESVMKDSYFYPYFFDLYKAVKNAVDKHAN